MIEDLEANLCGNLIYASNTENLVVAKDENSDEASTVLAKASNEMGIDLEYEQKIEAYK